MQSQVRLEPGDSQDHLWLSVGHHFSTLTLFLTCVCLFRFLFSYFSGCYLKKNLGQSVRQAKGEKICSCELAWLRVSETQRIQE